MQIHRHQAESVQLKPVAAELSHSIHFHSNSYLEVRRPRF